MDYEDLENLENRVSNLEAEIKDKLTWSKLIWMVASISVGILIAEMLSRYFGL